MSLSPISTLQKLGIPTHSYIAAAQAAGAMRINCDHQRYDQLIAQIMSIDTFHSESFPEAQMVFGYLVQELVRADLADQELNVAAIFSVAAERAYTFVKQQPWHWPESNNGDGKVTRIEEVRRVVDMFEGINRDVLVNRLCEDFEVTKLTALGWLRQLSKEPQDVGSTITKTAPKVRVNKGEAAIKIVEQLYTGDNKPEVLTAIARDLDTTPGGAQTFFYAAIKKLQLVVSKSEKSAPKSTTQDQLKAILEGDPTLDRKTFIEKAGEVGVKPSTAQTYYYALTLSLGIDRKGNGSRGRKKEGATSRIDQVIEYVGSNRHLSRAEIIEGLSSTFTVSKVSAQSYYYAATKALKETV